MLCTVSCCMTLDRILEFEASNVRMLACRGSMCRTCFWDALNLDDSSKLALSLCKERSAGISGTAAALTSANGQSQCQYEQ